jgi:hypothetical protein
VGAIAVGIDVDRAADLRAGLGNNRVIADVGLLTIDGGVHVHRVRAARDRGIVRGDCVVTVGVEHRVEREFHDAALH